MQDLINIKEVMALTLLARATVYRYVKLGKLPAPIKYANKLLWRENVIKNWISEQLGENSL